MTRRLTLAAAALLAAAPLAAQPPKAAKRPPAAAAVFGERPTLERRTPVPVHRDDDWDWDDEREGRRGPPFVPPGWCLGRGNPHNTPENCGPYADRTRRTDRFDRRDRWDRYGSFEEAHAAFHRELDRWCAAQRAERPLDLEWQLRVRQECARRHEEWHRRYDPRARSW